MYSRLAIFLLFVMFACVGTRVGAQQIMPDSGPRPPPISDVYPPRPLPPPPGTPNLPPDPVEPMPKTLPGDCGPMQHWGSGGCVDGAPEMGVTEINGIPWKEALEIYERHRDELQKIPGVMSVGIGVDGIILGVLPQHGGTPTTVDGLPVKTEPFMGMQNYLHHTATQKVRPFHGGLAFAQTADVPMPTCTMTTVALVHGDPWIVFPAHCLYPLTCGVQSHYPPGPGSTPLWQVSRYSSPDTQLFQPPNPGTSDDLIGWVQRHSLAAATPQAVVLDVAIAAMDNNAVDRDLSVQDFVNPEMDKQLEMYNSFNGQRNPVAGAHVTAVTADIANTGTHLRSAHISQLGVTIGAPNGCPSELDALTDQIFLISDNPAASNNFQNGDSGSPIVDDGGYIVGMLQTGLGSNGSGKPMADVQRFLGDGQIGGVPGYDSIYGQNATDLSVSVYPAFRSVVAGQGACAWVYIKNTNPFVIAQKVAIENQTIYSPQPAFNYQNPAGLWNIPSDIQPGQTARFAVCLNLNQTQIPILWLLNFYGTNAAAPVYKFAYNTLATRWTATATPDPAITTATLSNDDVVHTGGPSGTGAFSLTTVNNGASGAVTITLDTDDGDGQLLPYTLWVCETNAQAQCMSSLLLSLSLQMNASSVHYFSVFAAGQGQAVLLNPYYNRIYFRIREGLNTPTGTLVGAAGLSITTN